jgi:hypothetical protein
MIIEYLLEKDEMLSNESLKSLIVSYLLSVQDDKTFGIKYLIGRHI